MCKASLDGAVDIFAAKKGKSGVGQARHMREKGDTHPTLLKAFLA